MALFATDEGSNEEETWTLFFDGSSNVLGHGIVILSVSPEKQYIPMTTRLCFNCTNNIAEYEAYAMGI